MNKLKYPFYHKDIKVNENKAWLLPDRDNNYGRYHVISGTTDKGKLKFWYNVSDDLLNLLLW